MLLAFLLLNAMVLSTMTLFNGSPSAHAQTSSDVRITGGEGVVSVVSAPDGVTATPGTPPASNSAPPPATEWPWTCVFYVAPTLDSVAVTTTTPQPNSIYHLVCNPNPGFTVAQINDPFYVYNPTGPLLAAEPDLVTSLQVRQAAQNIVNPTDLTIGVSPAAQQITGVETWFWPVGDLSPQSVSATAGPLTVTIEAQYVETEFTTTGANQSTITCTEFVEWAPGVTNSPCATTFFEQTPTQVIEATTTWRLVWWDNAGQTTPVELGFISETQTTAVEVVDLEAVITRN